jgi:hypothetical protein
MKTYGDSGGIAPLILKLGTTCWWVVSFTLRPVWSQPMNPTRHVMTRVPSWLPASRIVTDWRRVHKYLTQSVQRRGVLTYCTHIQFRKTSSSTTTEVSTAICGLEGRIQTQVVPCVVKQDTGPWGWRQYVLPKRWHLSTGPYGFTTQRTNSDWKSSRLIRERTRFKSRLGHSLYSFRGFLQS